jgi:hypothetical protein
VVTDRDRNNAGGGPSAGRADQTIALMHETREALTALGNYLAVVSLKFAEQRGQTQEGLAEALEKSLSQYQRAVGAVRRLGELLHRQGLSDSS